VDRSIYGLKQAGYIWANTLRKKLTKLGYEKSTIDPGLYITTKPGLPSIVFTYVDDLLMVSLTKGKQEREQLTELLKGEFPMKTTDEVHNFLRL
jgi:hypothetical protein